MCTGIRMAWVCALAEVVQPGNLFLMGLLPAGILFVLPSFVFSYFCLLLVGLCLHLPDNILAQMEESVCNVFAAYVLGRPWSHCCSVMFLLTVLWSSLSTRNSATSGIHKKSRSSSSGKALYYILTLCLTAKSPVLTITISVVLCDWLTLNNWTVNPLIIAPVFHQLSYPAL